MSRFDELRARHPRFTYEDYAVERTGEDLRLTFSFTMAPDIAFAPTTTLRGVEAARVSRIPREVLDHLAFHLGLIELLSYWKTACAPEYDEPHNPIRSTSTPGWRVIHPSAARVSSCCSW